MSATDCHWLAPRQANISQQATPAPEARLSACAVYSGETSGATVVKVRAWRPGVILDAALGHDNLKALEAIEP